MPQIKFYYAPGACSLAPHILLRETGVRFEAIVNIVNMTQVTFIDDFPRINPKMRVPVISLDEEVITETPAVMTAISGLAPEMHLMGRTPLETIRVYEWLNWLSGTLHGQGFGAVLRPERYSEDPAALDGVRAKGMKHVGDCFEIIEGKLVDVYAVGGAITAVDPYLFVFYRWGNDSGFQMKERFPNYTALVSNLAQRTAVKVVLDIENIGSTL
jgi:glutathione S-transferase